MLFISSQKLFLYVRYLSFGLVAKRLDKKSKVNFKFYDIAAWLTIVMHILPNILRSKGNLAIKFGQSIEYNIKSFLEKSYTKCGGETSSRSFSKKLKLSISLDQ